MSIIDGFTSAADMDFQTPNAFGGTTGSEKAPHVSEAISSSDSSAHGYRDFAKQSSFWLQFTYASTNIGAQDRLRLYDTAFSTTQPVLRWRNTSGSAAVIEIWNGASWTSMLSLSFTNSRARYDLEVNLSDTGRIALYGDGLLLDAADTDTLLAGYTGIDRIRLGATGTGVHYYSAIIIADEDTRDMRLLQGAVNGAGAVNDWSGTYADVDETGRNLDDMISSDAATEVFLATKAAMPTGYGSTVEALILSYTARKAGSGPGSVEAAVRVGGTNYFGSGQTLDDQWKPYGHQFTQNPATSAAWTLTDIDNAQVGMRSAA